MWFAYLKKILHLICLTLSRSVAEDPRECSVDLSAIWKHDTLKEYETLNKQRTAHCPAVGVLLQRSGFMAQQTETGFTHEPSHVTLWGSRHT